jgi:hypothetical protein
MLCPSCHSEQLKGFRGKFKGKVQRQFGPRESNVQIVGKSKPREKRIQFNSQTEDSTALAILYSLLRR